MRFYHQTYQDRIKITVTWATFTMQASLHNSNFFLRSDLPILIVHLYNYK